jgi:AhpD family alkylhydroperoxidase
MALVSLINKNEATPEVRAILEANEKQFGKILHTWQAIAQTPVIFQAYFPFLRSVIGPGLLDQRIKELTALRVAILNHCRYTVSHRVASARKNGITEADLIGLRDPASYDFSPTEQIALAFAESLTTQVTQVNYSGNPQVVEPQILAGLKEHFTEPEIVELTLSISLWNALARFHRVMGLEMDMADPPVELDPALNNLTGFTG